MKFLVVSYTVLLALFAVQATADDGDSQWYNKPDGDEYRPDGRKTQVLWGQCGGYYYFGTRRCPQGAYCCYFSDWYSQCNLLGE